MPATLEYTPEIAAATASLYTKVDRIFPDIE
jgi:hypothetical protein